MKKLLSLLWFLNLLDAISTILALRTGLAYEANPVMRYFYHVSPVLFFFVKMGIVTAACLFMNSGYKTTQNYRKLFLGVVIGCNLLYVGVLSIHAYLWVKILQVTGFLV